MFTLITGAGGFIGHHLASHLRSQGHFVRGVDLKFPEFSETNAHEFVIGDLRDLDTCIQAFAGVDQAYVLAADMGGMGFLSQNQAQTLRNNSQIDLNSLEAARIQGCKRLLYASSACVYPQHLQTSVAVTGLQEDDAYPADPPDAYGWGKLMGERLCHYYRQDFGIQTRVARFHNIFGPKGTWQGGREKAPAAICRKVALAKVRGESTIEVWGDGLQTRSFCYIDDLLLGLQAFMASDYEGPLNLGQDRMISVLDLVQMVSDIAGHPVTPVHIDGPQGVRGRNSDNRLTEKVLGWRPVVSLEEGLTITYQWIEAQVQAAVRDLALK
jgi:nucleoside-diphosphate-sugar epimerase